MAVVIASDLGKDMAGEPLLRGVSFKLERRDRMTLSGRNGAGKTTLLRMLAGEASVDSGELVFSKGARSRSTTSARRGTADSACATTSSRARPSWSRSSSDLAALEQRMAEGDYDGGHAQPLLRRPGARSSTRAATTGASGPWPRCTASASATTPTSTARSTPSRAAS